MGIDRDMAACTDCHGMTAAHILCKNSANRTQWSLLNIAEVQPILCKVTT